MTSTDPKLKPCEHGLYACWQCGTANAPTAKCPYPAHICEAIEKAFDSLRAELARKDKALNDIIKHQEFVAGSASPYLTILKIAKSALRQEEGRI